MKNQLLLRTCVLMSCLACILGVRARDFDFVVNDICYNVTSSSTVEVTQNPAGNIGSVTIPATVNYNGRTYQVTAIGDNAFNQCTNMTSVTIGSNVATIGNYAFYACVGLKSVAIPNSVTTIGEMAFAECQGINNLTIGNSVTTIQLAAFENCHSLRRIVLPNSLTSLSARLFAGCNSLTSVTLGNSVTTIYASVFKDCSALTSMVLPATVTSLGNYVFQNCTSLASVTCMATTPPGIMGSTFTSSHYSSATLTVPKDCSAAYQAANYWKSFRTIQAFHYDIDVNGIYYRIKSGMTAEVTYRVNSLNSYSGNIVIPAM